MFRPFALAGTLLIILVSTVSGQTWAEKMFGDRVHDFGDVARGATAEYRFELTNLYEEDVHISGIRSSCSCTSLRVERVTLATHETAAIVAKINTDKFRGKKGATITVTFDKPYYAQIQLQTRVYIRTDVVFEPGSVEVGTVAQGQSADCQVTVAHTGRSGWRIVDVVSTNPHLTGTVEEISRVGGNTRYRLSVHLDENAPEGYVHEHLLLKTNDHNRTQVPILVQGRVEPSIVVSPTALFMGNVALGETVTRTVVLRGAKPFRVTSIRCADECFRFQTPDSSAEPKLIHIIPVTFEGGSTTGRLDRTIRVETDLGSPIPDLPAYAVVQ